MSPAGTDDGTIFEESDVQRRQRNNGRHRCSTIEGSTDGGGSVESETETSDGIEKDVGICSRRHAEISSVARGDPLPVIIGAPSALGAHATPDQVCHSVFYWTRNQLIDNISKIIFPSAFVIFNIAYWCYYLL